MKFTKVRTLEHLLKEYSGTTGTTGTQSTVKQLSEPTQQAVKDIKMGSVVVGKDKKNKVVVSPWGDGDIKDAMVVQGDDGEYEVVDQNQNVDAYDPDQLKQDPAGATDLLKGFSKEVTKNFSKGAEFGKFLTAGKLSKLAKGKGKKLKIKNIKNRIKRLARSKLKEADIDLFEINFNTKSVAKAAMDLPIRCGFEAETIFNDFEGGSRDDIDNLSWEEVTDEIYISNRDDDAVREGFIDWLSNEKIDEYLDDLVSEWITDNREDEDYLNDFIDSDNGPSSEAVERYKKAFEESDPKEYENREEDGWDYMNWVREYVEEEYENAYTEWLQSVAADEGDLEQEAREQAEGDHSMGDWIYDTYGSMAEFLEDYGIDYSEYGKGGLEDVARWMEAWSEHASFTGSAYVQHGEYGSTDGSTDSWAVEDDSSIEAGGNAGAEIISPVYPTPRAMLEEMRNLFAKMDEDSVSTNESTGLHVTMSWDGERAGQQSNAEPNKLKMATLLGDEYLLDTFGRLNNSYTKSQARGVKKAAQKIKNGDYKDLERMEQLLGSGISNDKFTSIHFKSQKDNDTGTNLIEFRIGGGSDYHETENFNKIVKAVIRYATIMEAGYTSKYQMDYAKAISRTVDQAGKIDPKDLERAKTRFDIDSINSPLVDLFKEMLSKENYLDGIGEISSALEAMSAYERSSRPGADKEWEQSIKDFEKNTGSKVPIKEVETVYGDLEIRKPSTGYVQPSGTRPSKRAGEYLGRARTFYAKALSRLAVDVQQGKNRRPINAKSIGIIRNSLKLFNIQESYLTDLITAHMGSINIPTQNDRSDQRYVILGAGLEKLFKKEMLDKPDFLRAPQIEKMVGGLWNAVNNNDEKGLDEIGKLLTAITVKNDENYKDNVDNGKYAWQTAMQKREFNDFYSSLTRGGYNASHILLNNGDVYRKDKYKELMAQLEKFPKYDEPVTPSHSTSIHSDDSYIENYLSKYTMKMRKRFIYLQDIKDDNLKQYIDSIKQLGKLLVPLTKVTALTDLDNEQVSDSYDYLAFSNYNTEKLTSIIKDIKSNDFSDPFGENVIARVSGSVTDAIRDALASYYKNKEQEPELYEFKTIKKLVTARFDAIKDFMTGFDKIAQQIGFDSQEDEIAGKRDISTRQKNFDKTIRKNNRPILRIPSHSQAYMRKHFYDKVTSDNGNYAMANREAFTTRLNKNSDVFVIAAAHWDQADEAVNIISLLDTLGGTPLGTSQEWRREGVKEIIRQYKKVYGVFPQDLDDEDYIRLGGNEFSKLKDSNIDVQTGEDAGDSREPHVEPLVSKDKIANPKSGEPFSRSSSVMWGMNNDDAEKKRFDAYPWKEEGISDKVKKQIAQLVNKGEAFNKALEQVIPVEETSDGALIKAGGVEDSTEDSSGGIGNKTNWELLAKSVGIEPGVNDQGAHLFQNVYNNFDSDYTKYRTQDDGPIIGMQRWLLAVKDAIKYVKKNYRVSGGNYFRQDADGNVGDDVSDVYSIPTQRDEPSYGEAYDVARAEHPKFDIMMRDGINDYMQRGEVNKLVAFLTHTNEDWQKTAVLRAIMNNKNTGGNIPLTLNQAKEIARSNAPSESVFTKFDKLTLAEQLQKLENIQKNKVNKIYENMGQLPDNNKAKMLNKILSKPLLGSDLQGQFMAYWALPVPQMISDFRSRRAQGGSNICLRSVLRYYIDQKLDPRIKKQIVKESKDDVIQKIESLPDDEKTDKIVSYIEQLLDDMGVGGRLASIITSLKDVDDDEVAGEITKIAKLIASIEMTPLERAQLFASWKADTLVDTSALTTPGNYTFESVFKGYKVEPYMTELVDDLADVSGYGIGAGEFLFAVLSKKITGIGATGGSGDLIIDGKNVEVKTKTARNARFVDWHVKPDQTWQGKTTQFYEDFSDLEEIANSPGTGVNATTLMACLSNPLLAQDRQRAKMFLQQVKGLFNTAMPSLSNAQLNDLIKVLNSRNESEFKQKYGGYNILNYLNIKRAKGDLDGVMFMDKQKKTVSYVRGIEDISNINLDVGTIYPVTKDKNYPYPQIGVKS